jgi:hypothetical protein
MMAPDRQATRFLIASALDVGDWEFGIRDWGFSLFTHSLIRPFALSPIR